MYTIEFYEDSRGYSAIWQFMENLRTKALSNKDARIQYKQIALYLNLLEKNGTYLPEAIVKYLSDGIWELRPGNNRILFFTYVNNTFVLLHHFRKKSQKLPKKEFDQAVRNRTQYIAQQEGNNENLAKL